MDGRTDGSRELPSLVASYTRGRISQLGRRETCSEKLARAWAGGQLISFIKYTGCNITVLSYLCFFPQATLRLFIVKGKQYLSFIFRLTFLFYFPFVPSFPHILCMSDDLLSARCGIKKSRKELNELDFCHTGSWCTRIDDEKGRVRS